MGKVKVKPASLADHGLAASKRKKEKEKKTIPAKLQASRLRTLALAQQTMTYIDLYTAGVLFILRLRPTTHHTPEALRNS